MSGRSLAFGLQMRHWRYCCGPVKEGSTKQNEIALPGKQMKEIPPTFDKYKWKLRAFMKKLMELLIFKEAQKGHSKQKKRGKKKSRASV
jgi:hypothetical protein